GRPARPAGVVVRACRGPGGVPAQLPRRGQARTAPAEGRQVLLVVAFRSEEVGPDNALRQLQPALRLALGRFDRRATRELVESMAGPLPDEALGVIERLSGGSPVMAGGRPQSARR